MQNNPLVTVIMPTYNRAEFIIESLACVKNQTYTNWECIIVDDGSIDNSSALINTYIEGDERFKYFKKENGGAAIARNYGILKSKGTYILPLDSDDLIANTYMGKAVQVFTENQHIKIVYSEAIKIGVAQGKWPLPKYSYKLFLVYNMIFNSAMYKRSDFDKVKGYTENSRFEDWDLWIKILKGGGEVYQIPETLYFYRTHKNDSVTSLLEKDEKLFKNSMDQLFKNHVDEYLEFIGNPIEIERERKALASIARSSNYKLALRIIDSKLFKFLRKVNRMLKRKKG